MDPVAFVRRAVGGKEEEIDEETFVGTATKRNKEATEDDEDETFLPSQVLEQREEKDWFVPPTEEQEEQQPMEQSGSVAPAAGDYDADAFDEIMPRVMTSVRVGNFTTARVKKLTFDARQWRWVQESPNPHEKGEFTNLSLRVADIAAIRYCADAPNCMVAVEMLCPLDRVIAAVFCPSRKDRTKYATVAFYFKKRLDVTKLINDLGENYVGIAARCSEMTPSHVTQYVGL